MPFRWLYFIFSIHFCIPNLIIHKFLIEDFYMVEDGVYQQFSWGIVAFEKLMKFFEKKYKPSKKLYWLNGFPYAPNIWIYECASTIKIDIAVKEGNDIPRICNWQVVGLKPKFEFFMETIFSEVINSIQHS